MSTGEASPAKGDALQFLIPILKATEGTVDYQKAAVAMNKSAEAVRKQFKRFCDKNQIPCSGQNFGSGATGETPRKKPVIKTSNVSTTPKATKRKAEPDLESDAESGVNPVRNNTDDEDDNAQVDVANEAGINADLDTSGSKVVRKKATPNSKIPATPQATSAPKTKKLVKETTAKTDTPTDNDDGDGNEAEQAAATPVSRKPGKKAKVETRVDNKDKSTEIEIIIPVAAARKADSKSELNVPATPRKINQYGHETVE